MKRNLILIIIIGGVFFAFSIIVIGQTAMKPQQPSGRLSVAASFYPLYFFSQQIGGDRADVFDITPAGTEPHDYEPTALDVAQIEKSRLLILNGDGLETWGNAIKQNIDANRTTIITAGQDLIGQLAKTASGNATDPHVWLSPLLAKQMVDKILNGFVQVDSANATYYQANALTLKAKLDDLDAAYKAGLNNCQQKDFVTAHAAFGYLASTYGLTQVPIAGLSPDAEPSPRQLAQIVSFAKNNNIKYIFYESLVSPKLAQTIAAEIGAQTLVLNPTEGLSNDEQAQGKNYFTEMQNNLINLRQALLCAK